MKYTFLMKIGCTLGGILLTRFSTSVSYFLQLTFLVISIGIFMFLIAYEVYTEYITKNYSVVHQRLWELPAACLAFFITLLGVRWLQGYPELLKSKGELLSTLNISLIMTYIFTILYKLHMGPRLRRFFRDKKQNHQQIHSNKQQIDSIDSDEHLTNYDKSE